MTIIQKPETSHRPMYDLRITPTIRQVSEARTVIAQYEVDLQRLSTHVQAAEIILQKAVEERDRAADKVKNARTYISPGRRLPREILEQIWKFNFIPDGRVEGRNNGIGIGAGLGMRGRRSLNEWMAEHSMASKASSHNQDNASSPSSHQQQYDPLAPFTYANVCSLWRQVILSKPAFFSKIRITPRMKSPCTLLRLWIERSGTKCPLDIEIDISLAFLQQPPRTADEALRMSLQADQMEVELASAMYLLVAHMERWTRFSLLGDVSDRALVPLIYARGNAPLLRSFEVSTRIQRMAQTLPPPPEDNTHWAWLERLRHTEPDHDDTTKPSASSLALGFHSKSGSDQRPQGPFLEALRMENVHFVWTSAKFTGLKYLVLRCSPSGIIPGIPSTANINPAASANLRKYTVDEVLNLLSCNPNLVSLCLQMPVTHSRFLLPLPYICLEKLKHLELYDEPNAEGMASVLSRLSAPLLENLSLATSGHFGPGDAITPFLTRSNFPPLRTFTYHNAHQNACSYQGLQSGSLQHMRSVTTMTFTRVFMESILNQISASCKRVRKLTIASLEGHALTSAIVRLIDLVNDRNPEGGKDFEDDDEDDTKLTLLPGSPPLPPESPQHAVNHPNSFAYPPNSLAPRRIRFLEFLDCGEIEDGIMQWLKSRIPVVRRFNREPVVVMLPNQRPQSSSDHSMSP